jgi:lysozyme
MNLSESGKFLIKKYEGCILQAYLCPAKVWTIGFGNTYHIDGTPIKEGDKITKEQANEYFEVIVNKYVTTVNQLVKAPINANQHAALVSLCYNIGPANFNKSTVLRLVNLNPNDPEIEEAFMMWNKAKGKVLKGLVKRRQAEWLLYSSK